MIYAIWSDKAGGWLNDSSGRIFEFYASELRRLSVTDAGRAAFLMLLFWR